MVGLPSWPSLAIPGTAWGDTHRRGTDKLGKDEDWKEKSKKASLQVGGRETCAEKPYWEGEKSRSRKLPVFIWNETGGTRWRDDGYWAVPENDKSRNVLKHSDANDDRKEQDEKLMTAGGLKWETGRHQDSLAHQLQCNSNLGSTEGCALQSFAIQTRSSALITLHTRQKKVGIIPHFSSFFIESFYHPA